MSEPTMEEIEQWASNLIEASVHITDETCTVPCHLLRKTPWGIWGDDLSIVPTDKPGGEK